MPTKLGFQLHSAANNALDRLRETPPAALLVYNNVDLLNAAYDAIGAGPVYLHQQAGWTDLASYIRNSGGMTAAVRRFISELQPTARALPWAYHVTFAAGAITDELVQFETQVIEQAAELNVQLCVGNFASGTPQPTDWARYRPVLEAAVRHNALIGLREVYPVFPYVGYGPNANIPNKTAPSPRKLVNEIAYPQGYTQPGMLVGRYRHLRDYCRQQKLDIRMVITESGAGRVLDDWLNSFGTNLSGWNTLAAVWQRLGFSDAQVRYFQDLVWLDQHVYSADPEVIGTCVYGWNVTPTHEIASATRLISLIQNYLRDARRSQPLPYTEYALMAPASFKVVVTRVRIRAIPSYCTKPISNLEYGESFTASHYTFHDGFLWLKHNRGWSAYTTLLEGNPLYNNKFLEGQLITTPRQAAAVNNFVGTLSEIRNFLQAHQGQMFYIAINPGVTPEGARTFSVTTFPVNQGRRILDQLHPAAGQPRMSPEAKNKLRQAGQL